MCYRLVSHEATLEFGMNKIPITQFVIKFSRYTVVLLIYAFSLLMTITLRPWLLTWDSVNPGKKAIYCALYFYPILVLIHTVAAGLICKY